MNFADIDAILIEISKYSLIIAFIIYFLFSVILIRQAVLMGRTIIAGFNKYLVIFCLVHLAVFLWFAFFVMSLVF